MTKKRVVGSLTVVTLGVLFLAYSALAQNDLAPQVIEPEAPPVESPATEPLQYEEPQAPPVKPAEPVEQPVVTQPQPAASPDTTSPQVAEAPIPVPAPFVPKAPTAPTEQQQQILDHPTRSVEAYEKTRLDYVWKQSQPNWGVNLLVAPRAYRNADLRVPISAAPSEGRPYITGLLVDGERVLFHSRAGQVNVGAELGSFGGLTHNQFSGLLTAITSLGAYVLYQGQFIPRQVVVPIARIGYEGVRVSYSYAGNAVHDFRVRPRFELGGQFYLNWLEPSSAGLMQSNYGVKRTYLIASYSFAPDSAKTKLNLEEEGAWRLGFRFEF